MKEKDKNFIDFLGRLVGKIIVMCLASIIVTGVMAVSAKIIHGLILWLF